MGGGGCVSDFARLVGGGRAVRRDCPGSAGLCENEAGSGRGAARVQGAESASAEDAATGRAAGDMLVQPSRRLGGLGGGGGCIGGRCASAGPIVAAEWGSTGSSRGAESAGDRIFEVPGA